MTGILQKALRGAATAGAQLSMEQVLANIMAKRDEQLQKYQTSERMAGQEFKTSEREAGEAHDLELQKLKNEGSKTGGAVQGDIQLMEYMVKNGVAKDQNDAFTLIKTMKSDPNKGVMDLAKMMQAADTANMVENRPVEDYLKDAKSLVRQYLTTESKPEGGKGIIGANMSLVGGGEGMGGTDAGGLSATEQKLIGGGSANSTGGIITIQSDDDFNKLRSGTRFKAPDGTIRIKP